MYIYTYIHIYTYTHTHTHIHIHTYRSVCVICGLPGPQETPRRDDANNNKNKNPNNNNNNTNNNNDDNTIKVPKNPHDAMMQRLKSRAARAEAGSGVLAIV